MKAKTFLVILVAVFVAASASYAQDETVEISTYYPAPYGEYEELSASEIFLPPRLTTAQRDAISSPIEGMMIYNTTNHRIEYYRGTTLGWGVLLGQVRTATASIYIDNPSGPSTHILDVMLDNPIDGIASITEIRDYDTFTVGDWIKITKTIMTDRVRFTIELLDPTYNDVRLTVTGIAIGA